MIKLSYASIGILLFIIVGSVLSLVFRTNPAMIIEVLLQKEILFALRLSIITSLISLFLTVLLGIPAAWILAFKKIPFKGVINAVLDLPMVMPPLVAGLGLLLLLGQSGPFGKLYTHISSILFSPAGIVIAQVYLASSIFIRNAISNFVMIDRDYIDTASNLGLNSMQTLFLVEIPLCWRPLLGGCILAFSRAIGEFGATLMLAGATRLKTETLPMAIFLNIAGSDLNAAIVCACVLLFFACLLLTCLHLIKDKLFISI